MRTGSGRTCVQASCAPIQVAALKTAIDQLPATNVRRAAALLGITVRSVYRWILLGKLERIRRRGTSWVSERSISQALEEDYLATGKFNIMNELREKCDTKDKSDTADVQSWTKSRA